MGGRRAPRRKLVWATTAVDEANFTVSQATDLLTALRATAGGGTLGVTVMRVIVKQNAVVGAGTGTEATSVRVGIIVAQSLVEADVVDPVAEPNADWMWNSRYFIGNNTLTMPFGEDTKIDVRTGRKVDEVGSSLWLAVSPQLGGATNLTYRATARVLLALP